MGPTVSDRFDGAADYELAHCQVQVEPSRKVKLMIALLALDTKVRVAAALHVGHFSTLGALRQKLIRRDIHHRR